MAGIMARRRSRCYSADSEVEGLWHEGRAWATSKVPPCLNVATLEHSKCHGRASHWHQTSTDGCTPAVTDRPTSEDHGDVPQVADFKLPVLNGPAGARCPVSGFPGALTEHVKLAGNMHAESRRQCGVVLVVHFQDHPVAQCAQPHPESGCSPA